VSHVLTAEMLRRFRADFRDAFEPENAATAIRPVPRALSYCCTRIHGFKGWDSLEDQTRRCRLGRRDHLLEQCYLVAVKCERLEKSRKVG